LIVAQGGDSSGKLELKTPQKRSERGGLSQARGKRPPEAKISIIILSFQLHEPSIFSF